MFSNCAAFTNAEASYRLSAAKACRLACATFAPATRYTYTRMHNIKQKPKARLSRESSCSTS